MESNSDDDSVKLRFKQVRWHFPGPVVKTYTEKESSNEATEKYPDNSSHVNSSFQYDDDDCQYKLTTLLSRFGGKGRRITEFEDATDVTYIDTERILVTDMINNRIVCYSETGKLGEIYDGSGIKEPWATAVTHDGKICLTSRKHKDVMIMSSNGEKIFEFGHDYFQRPCGIAVINTGQFVVSDILSGEVSIHEIDGRCIQNLTDPTSSNRSFTCPRYVSASSNGCIMVSDSGEHCVKVFDDKGNFVRKIGKYGKGDGHMRSPYGVTSDSYGNLIVADHYNDRISLFSNAGEFICHIVTAKDGVVHPQGVDLSSDLKLFITHGNLKAHMMSVFKIDALEGQE